MRKFTIKATLCVMFGLLAVGQAFAVEKWTDEAIEPPLEGDVYQVSTPGQLAWFAINSIGTGTSAKIKLVADLDLKGKLWLPIGAGFKEPGFNGQFDGDGHTIKNLYIRSEDLLEEYTLLKKVDNKDKNCIDQNIGLFGINGGGSIKNLNLENVDIYATNDQGGCGNEISVGGLVGWKTTVASTIENIVVSGKIYTSGKGQGVGGLIGNAHSSSISNSVSKVNITADGDNAFVGGLVGLIKNKEVKITSCVYAGETLESNGSGGAVGAVAGKVYKDNANANASNVYYDSDVFEAVGTIGNGGTTSGTFSPVSDVNNEEIICKLNKGTLDENNECDKQSPWSVGGENISWNGSDGFKVTFDADGGFFPEDSKTFKMLSNGNAITADEITSPSKSGASFVGWSLTKGASEPSDLGFVSAPTRVYAVWKPVFTITFDANGGSFPDGSLKKEKGVAKGDVITVEGIGALPESYCLAYSGDDCDDAMYFTGWSFNPNPSTESEIVDLNQLNVFATQNTTLYAVWTEVITYTVTFNAGGHGKTKVNFVRVGAGESLTQPVDPSADEGYVFDRWFTEDGHEFKFETMSITKSIILYAHWIPVEYDITYMLGDDCTNNPDNPSKYTLETPTFKFKAPSRVGYTFDKWYYDDAFSKPATQITQGTTTGSMTLYPKWIPNVYTITYRLGSEGHGTVLPSSKEHGTAINLKLVNDGFERPGYTQTGWSTTDGGEKEYESGASYAENHDLTLYPTWGVATYTITYVCDACTDVNNPDSYTMFDDADLMFKKPIYPGNNQYHWIAWYQDANFTKKIQTIKKGSYGDTTIYAKLLKYYNLTYELNGRKVKANNAVRYDVETTVELKAPDPASIDGYIFDGWYDNANFEGEAVTSIAKGSEGDKTFYAKWIQEYGAITIVSNIDGTNSAVINGTYGGGDEPNFEEADETVISSDITVNSVTLNRTFNAGKIATLYVPFEIDAENVVGTEVYKFKTVVKSDEDNRWKFKVSTATKIMPNTPYVIIPEGTQVTFDITAPVTLNTTTEGEATAANSWQFVGAYQYEKFTLDNNNPIYLFADQARDGAKLGEFVKIADGAYINPMRAYLVYHKTLAKSARGNLGSNILLPDELDIEVENENGIVVQTGTLNTVTGEVRMDRWYDLKGRKLNSKPTVKGTYYKNGKRVVIK